MIFGILLGWMYLRQPTPEELEAQKAEQEQLEAAQQEQEQIKEEPAVAERPTIDLKDSVAVANYKSAVGAFGFTQTNEATTVLENEVLFLEVANKGGQIVEAKMKDFVTFDSIPVYLVKDGNADFGLTFTTSDNRVLQTQDLYFEPSLTQSGENNVLSMKARVSANQFLEYRYELKPNEYLVDFTVRSQGLSNVFKHVQSPLT